MTGSPCPFPKTRLQLNRPLPYLLYNTQAALTPTVTPLRRTRRVVDGTPLGDRIEGEGMRGAA